MAEDPLAALGISTPVDVDLDLVLEQREGATWPESLETSFQNLQQVKRERVVNAAYLGDLAFTNADDQVGDIIQILADLRLEDWTLIRDDLGNQIINNAGGLLSTMAEMAALRATQANAASEKTRLQQQFDSYYRFFVDDVRPLALTARVVNVLQARRDLLGGDMSEDRIAELRQTFQKLETDVEDFKSLSDLVSAQRQLVGKEGVSDLSHHFTALAEKSNEEFQTWATRLAAAVVIGGIAAVGFVYATRPDDDAGTPAVVTHTILDLLVVGLVLFLIRFLAVQTRAHRHVEFVARNKANALSTFNLIVAGQQDEVVRAQIASALAQAVFKSDDGIFSDASGDTVTIIERVIGAATTARPPGTA